jgi:hypothetical protein
METYAGTRAAAAEIATSLMTVGAGAVALQKVTPGVMSLGPTLAAALAQNAASPRCSLQTRLRCVDVIPIVPA